MKTKLYPEFGHKQQSFTFPNRWLLLLFGHICGGILIWFHRNPGLQLWLMLPIINGLATVWLLAKPNV